MLVIADATPLNILVRLDCAPLLEHLFDIVYVPPAVVAEMSDAAAPAVVRAWASKLPPWLLVRSPERAHAYPDLGRGESQAIDLALELHADLLLVDDRPARREALRLGLPIMGTLGIIERADALGLLELPAAIAAIRATDFRIASSMLDESLTRWQQRKPKA
jgi:predicted nucleic acid-binding protein